VNAGWHISENGLRRGPIAEADLRSMIAGGQVQGHTMVWREGMENWQPVCSLPDLCAGHPWLAAQAAGQMSPANGLAITSMVCGILSLLLVFVFCGMISGLAALPAVIFGHMALRAIRDAQAPMGGRGMAIAGLVTGYLGLLAQLAAIGFFAFAFLAGANGVGP
jgi:hypothetical protein